MSKRKRGPSVRRGAEAEVDMVDLTGDDPGVPPAKQAAVRPRVPEVSAGGSTNTTGNKTNNFSAPKPSTSSKALSKGTESDEPTPEQERRTKSCRQMRKAVMQVISEVHEDLAIHQTTNCPVLINNLWMCWTKYPLMFAHASKALDLPLEDLSTALEIEEFLPWWLHGLSSLLFFKDLQPYRHHIKQYLKTVSQFLKYGNPELVEVCFLELLRVLVEFSKPGKEKIKLTVETEDKDGSVNQLDISIELNSNDDAILEFLDILRLFLPQVFYFKVIQREEFLKVLMNVWTELNEKSRFLMFSKFILPTMPLLSLSPVHTEISITRCFTEVIPSPLGFSDSQSLSRFLNFCELMWKGVIPVALVPDTFILRLHCSLSKLIISDTFNAITSDCHRKGIVKLYLSLTDESSKIYGQEKLRRADLNVFEKATDSWPSITISHPMLEEAIFNDLQDGFDATISAIIKKNSITCLKRVRSRRRVEIVCKNHSKLWAKMMLEFEAIVSSQDDNLTAWIDALKKTCYTIEVAGRIHCRLMTYVSKLNSESKMGMIWMPDFQLLTEDNLKEWTDLVEGSILQSISSGSLEKVVPPVLNALDSFAEGNLLYLRPSIALSCRWVVIVAFPWIKSLKILRLLPNKYLGRDFIAGLANSAPDNASPFTKARCLRSLRSRLFLHWKDFVLAILFHHIEYNSERQIYLVLLEMIANFYWPIRSIQWSYLSAFIYKIIHSYNWRNDVGIRNRLAGAIAKIPCIYSNQRQRASSDLSLDDKLKMEIQKCSICSKAKGEFIVENMFMSPQDVLILVKLSSPILESRFLMAKLELTKLISSVRSHSKVLSKEFVAAFTRTATHGNMSLGTVIMKHLSYYLRPMKWIASRDTLERTEAVEVLFNTLQKSLKESLERTKFVRFSVKVLITLQQLTVNADQLIMVKMLKFALQMLASKESNVINMLSQSLVGVLASKCGCLSWELMIRLRYELAEEIIALAVTRFCDIVGDQVMQAERHRLFFTSICTMGEFRTTAIFIHHFYPILLEFIVPSLYENKQMQFVFKSLTNYASLSESQILQDGFHNYYRALALGHNPEKIGKAFMYLKKKYSLDPNVVAFSVLQGTLNEMLCYLYERKEKVVKFIPQLLRRDGRVGINTDSVPIKTVARSEIQELLSKHLMGFFVFVDTKLHSRLESMSTKRRILRSFTVLIDLMGKTRMTTNRTKVYATLNSLFSLGPDFHDLLFEAWKTFSANLEDANFAQMSAQILAALLLLRKTIPKPVDNLISYFVVSKKEVTSPFFQEFYFLLDCTQDANVQKLISASVSKLRSKSWGSYFEMLVKESCNENSHIRFRAIKKLHTVLIHEYEYLHENILEKEHPVVAQLLRSFLNASRDADKEMLMLLAESFGSLGAVDPYRFKDSGGDELKRKTTPTFTVTGPTFAARFLDLLVKEFQESEDTTDFDYCACLIQQVLKHYKVQPNQNDPVWDTMSATTKALVEPLLTSKYKVDKEPPKPTLSFPIYLSEHGKSFHQWLSNWLSLLITYVPAGSPAYDLFKFTKYMIPRNNRIASFLLPYVATFAVVGGTERQKQNIILEIEMILKRWIEQDAMKVNSQIMVPVKDDQTELGTPESDSKKFCDEDVFQYRCTQEIFSVFDHLFRGVRQAKRQAGLLKANLNSRTARPNDQINPSLTEENAETITRLLSHIPMSTVSQVAFHCEDYTRALFYVEQDLNRSPDKVQDSLNYLQQIFVSLNDMDSVLGVSAVRKREPTMSEIILENIAKGKVDVAIRSLELMVSSDPDDLIAHHGLLQAYLNLDEPRKAETLVKGCLNRNPHWEIALNEAQVEASWKLRDWSRLKTQIARTTSSKSDVPLSWNMTIVKILSFVKDLQLDKAGANLKEVRVKLMIPLVAASNDYNGYRRGYPNAVQLHILTEVEQVIRILKETHKEHNMPMKEVIVSLHSNWEDRLNALLQSQKFIDPVLDVRRTLLEILKESLHLDPQTICLIEGSVRDCWLKVATVESKSGNFIRASNCLVEAKKFMSAKVMIEHAKLLSRKGEKEQAIRVLQSGLSKYFPKLEDWKRMTAQQMVNSSTDIRLWSKALLLHAKLCDEQHLLDFEENIKNYRSSTEVFRESEKNFYTLASYYDRMWSNKEQKHKQSDIQAYLVKYYAQSLHYGCKYVYQSLPRLLSIWFDYSAMGLVAPSNPPSSNYESPPEEWSMTVSQMQETIKKVMKDVPTYVLLTAFPQLISRICHGNVTVWELLKEIICSIICNHPHQALWMTMAVSKSSYEMRHKRCKDIFETVKRKKTNLKKLIGDYTLLADHLISVCVKDVATTSNKASMQVINKNFPKLLNFPGFSQVLMPFQVFLSPSLPLKGAGHKTHDAFPQKLVFIRDVDDAVTIMASLQKPKKINLLGSDGKYYGLLCKAKDDLRKDCKVMEVNNVVNWYLHRNPDSRQRQLHVRMYAVTPLNEEHGLLEWVPDLSGFRGNMLSIYRERGIPVSMKDIRYVLRNGDPLHVQREKYLTKLIKPHPPCFSEWFLNNFNDPQSWYKARLSFTRTAAVMSIVGFVLGLGDRHGENILLDSSTGDVVHVDFNCLFNKGETFDVPERVPFRLTQNIVEAMGPLGVEGVFRRSCEITMSMIREHKSIFLSVIHPFVFDPLVEWGVGPGSGRPTDSTGEVTNSKAVEHMKHINNRIDGSARNLTKEKNTELSVEAQVAYLIDEARNVDNLCRMYIGWTAFL